MKVVSTVCQLGFFRYAPDHPSYQDWSVSMGRDDCFRTLVPFLEECLGDISCSQNASLTNPSGVLFGILGSRARDADKMSNAGHTLMYHPVTGM